MSTRTSVWATCRCVLLAFTVLALQSHPVAAQSPGQTYRAGTPERSVDLTEDDSSDGGGWTPRPVPANVPPKPELDTPRRVGEEVLDANACVKRDVFEREWRIYSDFDPRIPPQSRSWEVQQHELLRRQIWDHRVKTAELEAIEELARQGREEVQRHKEELVRGLRRNLVKALLRLGWSTYGMKPSELPSTLIGNQLYPQLGIPLADITERDTTILRDQRVAKEMLEQALAASQQASDRRQALIQQLQRQIAVKEGERQEWETREKERVFRKLNRDCKEHRGGTAGTAAPGDSRVGRTTEAVPDDKPRQLEAASFALVDTLVLPYQYRRDREAISLTKNSLHVKTVNTDRYYLHEMGMNWNEPPSTLSPGTEVPLRITGFVREVETKGRQPIAFGREADWKAGLAERVDGQWKWRENRLLPSPSPRPFQLGGDYRGQPAIYHYRAPGDGYRKVEQPGERFLKVPGRVTWNGKPSEPKFVYVMLASKYSGEVVWIYRAQPSGF